VFKAWRHHADYLNCFSVELKFLPDDVWVASKTARPKEIAEHDNVVSARLEFFRFEHSTARGSDSKYGEEIGGSGEAEQTFGGVALLCEIAVLELVCGKLFKDRILVMLVKEVPG
jgi:hypothetical protein